MAGRLQDVARGANAALFPGLLGERFASLDKRVRAVHGGNSGCWRGTATVQRGRGWLMRAMAFAARLPASQRDAPAEVTIEAQGDREIWTRRFGDALPMRSTLHARNGLLVEQLGLTTLRFRIVARDGGINWELLRVSALGLPLPRHWFQVRARSEWCERGYRFSVSVQVAAIGDLIRYDGQLQVPRFGR